MLDDTSILARWLNEAKTFASQPFNEKNGWVDFILLVLLTVTISWFWTRILDAHLPGVPK